MEGNVKRYTINVKKKNKKLRLKELEIKNILMSPKFNSDIFEYNVSVQGNDINNLEIDATPNREDAKVDIIGNNNLEIGNNRIEIKLTSEKNEEEKYIINVQKIEKSGIKDNIFVISLAIIIMVIIIILVIEKLYK